MSSYEDRERAIRELIGSGLARDCEHAIQILDEMAQKAQRADMFIFYTDYHQVRACFGEHIIDERPYNNTTIRIATVPSGAISQVVKAQALRGTLAIGALKEFVSKPADGGAMADQDAELVAIVRDFPFRGKLGIFLSPYSAKAVHDRGGSTFDERRNLCRIEFQPIAGDYVLGMFSAWSQQPEKDDVSLVLYMPKSRVIFL